MVASTEASELQEAQVLKTEQVSPHGDNFEDGGCESEESDAECDSNSHNDSDSDSASNSDSDDESNPEALNAFDPRLRVVSKALKDIQPRKELCVSGTRTVFPLPTISFDGLGVLVPPLIDVAMNALVDTCKTLLPYPPRELDEEIKVLKPFSRHWELSSGQFRLENPAWNDFIQADIVPACTLAMGIPTNVKVEAKLSKLIVSGVDGKVTKHHAIVDQDATFGKLLVVLPGRFQGGDVVVYHPPSHGTNVQQDHAAQPVYTSDYAASDPFAIKYTAFYGDCWHQVRPVTDGYRLCVVYDLAVVAHSVYGTLKDALCEFFCKDEQANHHKRQRLDAAGANRPTGFDITNPTMHRRTKLVYLLGHKYEQEDMSFQYLKSKDSLVAHKFQRFCGESHGAFALYLCKIKYEFKWRGVDLNACDSESDSSETDGDESADESEADEEMESADANEESEEEDANGDDVVTERLQLSSPWIEYGHGREHAVPIAAPTKWETVEGDLTVEVAPACCRSDRNAPIIGDMPCHWRLASDEGTQILEAASKLGDLDVIRNIVASCDVIEFQPKLQDVVEPFASEQVAAMAKAISDQWSKREKRLDDYNENRVHLVASLLDGVTDASRIKLVLDAVRVVPYDLCDFHAEEVEQNAEGYARVLKLASLVSTDQAKVLLASDKLWFFVYVAARATQLLIESHDGGWKRCSKTIRTMAGYTIAQLTAALATQWSWQFPPLKFSCHTCRATCECGVVKNFMASDKTTDTMTRDQVDHLTRLGLRECVCVEALVVTKTKAPKVYRKAQQLLDDLKRQMAQDGSAESTAS